MNLSKIFEKFGLKKISLNAVFGQLDFEFSDGDREAAWDMYVELITRVTTQPLVLESGDEKSALGSIYMLFPATRSVLKGKGRQAVNFTKIAVVVLNQVIRPFTAKWHRKMMLGAFENVNECKQFRGELEVLQEDLRKYSRILANMAEVEDLTKLDED